MSDIAVAAKPRLTREEWLARALELLARRGNAKLRVDAICNALGVTKGSFYWHFRDREDFQHNLVEYWRTNFTSRPIEALRTLKSDARDRLWSLMTALHEQGYPRYDVSVRAWAAQDPHLAELVRKVDDERLDFVRSLFAEMGFSGADLEMRTRLFVVYHSMEPGLFEKEPEAQHLDLMKRRHALLTRP